MFEVNKGMVDLSSKFNLPPISKRKVKEYFFTEKIVKDKYGMKNYTYIPNLKGLDEEGLKLQMIDAYETSAAQVWENKMEYATNKMTTDRYFERVPIHYGTKAPSRFKGDRVYHTLRFNSAEVVAVEYSDGYTWKLRDEMSLQIRNAISEIATGHIADYASIPSRQFSKMIQASADDDYYPQAVVSAFDDAAIVNAVSGRLMSAANEAVVAGTFAGNTLTGTMGVTASIVTLAADIENVLKGFSLMEHPEQEGDKFWENPEDNRCKLIFYVPPFLVRLFNKLISSELLPVTDKVTNNEWFKTEKFIVKTLPHLNGSAADLSYYVQLFDPIRPNVKPGIEVDAESERVPEIETWGWDTGNKEMSDTLSKAVGYYKLKGYGAGLPQSIVKVLNT